MLFHFWRKISINPQLELIHYQIKDNIFDGVSKHYNNGELSKEIIFQNGIKVSKKYYN